MFEFLQRVLYIPNPIIIAAKVAKGIRRKAFVLRPMVTFHDPSIKL